MELKLEIKLITVFHVSFESHLYGIETSDAEKREAVIKLFESHLYGIETFDWLLLSGTTSCLNRTFMELKHRSKHE